MTKPRMDWPARHTRKILPLDELDRVVRSQRAHGATVVQCHGCFDIVHPGHLHYLEFASRQGDLLIVTLTGDASIGKGDQRPYIPQELRAESLAAIEFVDYVCVDDSPTAERVLTTLRPDVYVKGREYATTHDPRFLAEQAIVESYGGRVIFSSGDVVFSSTQMISALADDAATADRRLAVICGRHAMDREGMQTWIDAMAGLRVGVVGDVILDRYVHCDALDVASESPVMSIARRGACDYVGGAGIVARHVAAMGAEPLLVSSFGKDPASLDALAALAREGVACHPFMVRERLVQKTRFLVEDNKLLKVEEGGCEPLDSRVEQEVAVVLERHARDLDAVIFCDFGYGTLTASLLERILPSLRANVAVLAGDVSGARGNLLNLRYMDLLCPTERELRAAVHNHEEGLSAVAWHLMNRVQARHLVCTLGQRGLVLFDRCSPDPSSPQWSDRLRSEHFGTFADHCLDRLGCGDALLSAATLMLAAGAPLVHAAYLGNAAAALAARTPGNLPISADALRAWLATRQELVSGACQVHVA